MKRQGIAINEQLTGFVPEPNRPISNLQVNFQRLILGLLTLGLVSCAPAKPPATPSPSVEAKPIATPTPSTKPSVSPSPKPSTSSSGASSIPDAPPENRTESERSSDSGGSVEEAPIQKSKAAEGPGEKPQRAEKPVPAVEPDPPARAPQRSEVAPSPPTPKSPKSPTAPAQPDDPEPPSL